MWAHHIKRIILENHHAIIPQKVKGHSWRYEQGHLYTRDLSQAESGRSSSSPLLILLSSSCILRPLAYVYLCFDVNMHTVS